MADRLQAELAQTRLELQQLKERMETGAVTVHRDLSVIALITKRSGSEPPKHVEKLSLTREASVRIGRREPENTGEIITLKLEASKVNPASSRFNMGPKFQREGIEGHKFDPTLRIRPKVASEVYKCQGIGHFAKGCPAQRRRRGRTRNSPGKGNPSERARSREAKSNPRL
jgi:hypothetical protein